MEYIEVGAILEYTRWIIWHCGHGARQQDGEPDERYMEQCKRLPVASRRCGRRVHAERLSWTVGEHVQPRYSAASSIDRAVGDAGQCSTKTLTETPEKRYVKIRQMAI